MRDWKCTLNYDYTPPNALLSCKHYDEKACASHNPHIFSAGFELLTSAVCVIGNTYGRNTCPIEKWDIKLLRAQDNYTLGLGCHYGKYSLESCANTYLVMDNTARIRHSVLSTILLV